MGYVVAVSYTHLRAHETLSDLVCRLLLEKNFFFLMIRRPPRSTPLYSSAASDVYKRQSELIPIVRNNDLFVGVGDPTFIPVGKLNNRLVLLR